MALDAAAVVNPVMTTVQPIERRGAMRVLDRSLAHGVTWTGGIKGIALLLSWASTIIVARILNPADYGLVAMATLYLGLTMMVTDFGLGAAMVALRDLSQELAAQLHAVAALVGLGAFVLSCLVAVPLSRFFHAPALAPVVVVLSAALVLDSLRTVPTALLARDLRFKYLALLEGLKVLAAAALTLALAVFGARHWALVLGNVFATLVVTLLVLGRLPQRFARPRFRTLKSTLTFSSHFLMGQLAWYGYSNADFLIAGRVLGRVALGEYSLAWTLTNTPGDKIMSIFGRLMPTMFAAVQRDVEALRRYFFLFTEALAILIVPMSVGLALVARDFVLLVFGVKWSAAIVPLQLLCCYSSIHLLAVPLAPVLQVKGQASFPMRMAFYALAILPPAFYFSGVRWGTVGVAAIWLAVYPLILLPIYARVFSTLEIGLGEYFARLGPTILSAAVMTVVVMSIRMLAPSAWPLAMRFGLQVACGAAAFVASALFIQRRRLGLLADFLRTIRS